MSALNYTKVRKNKLIPRAAWPVPELIVPRLEQVTELAPRNGKRSSFNARCPAHDDSRPSLDIDETEDGVALLSCRSQNCEPAEIVEAIGLEMRHLFPTGSRRSSDARREPRAPEYTLLSEGAQARLYRAAKTLMLDFHVLRRLRDEKGISANVVELAWLGWDDYRREVLVPYGQLAYDRWRFKEDRDDGKPAKAAYGHPRPLYTPHAVLAELELDTGTLLVCEGPLDALTACSAGYAAVAAPSAGTWKSDYADAVADFAPARVIVVGDCDQAGRKHAARAARDLAAHGLPVVVLELDAGRHDGYDIGAHLLEHGRLP